jgi:tRNA (Thr-GGU) A37 N-methylase
VDILDDTPLLDIKPYVPQYDNYPVQRCGWLDTVPDKPVVADDRFERKEFQSDSAYSLTQTNYTTTQTH